MGNERQADNQVQQSAGKASVQQAALEGSAYSLTGGDEVHSQNASAKQINRLNALTDSSSAVQRLARLSDEQPVQRVQTPQTSPSLNVSLEQEMFLLQGYVTTSAKIKGFFGSESTFSKLQKQVNQYTGADAATKERLKSGIISLGNEWLTRHVDSKDPNDQLKRQSITRIIGALQDTGKTAPVEIASMSDKVTAGTRLQESITGKKSTFQEIEPAFLAYQETFSSSVSSMNQLLLILQRGQRVKTLCLEWQKLHGTSSAPADVEKGASVAHMLSVLDRMNVSVDVPPYFSANLKGIRLSDASDGVIRASEAELTVDLPGGKATGKVTEPLISSRGIEFVTARLSYSGKLQFGEALSVTGPYIDLTQLGDSYSIKAGGGLALNASSPEGVTSLTASGQVEAGYDFSGKKFLSPVIEQGKLDITLFNALQMKASGIQYRDGQFSADSGILTIQALGKTISGSMNHVRYSATDGLSFSEASLASESSYAPVDGFSIQQPTLTLQKDTAGWVIGGSGQLGIEWSGGGIQLKKLEADVSLQYDLNNRSLRSFSVTKGALDLSIYDQLTVEVADFGLTGGAISAATAGVKLTLLGKEVTSSLQNLSYSKAGGLGFDELSISSPETYEPIPGFSVKNPTLTLLHKGDQWDVKGDGRLGLTIGGTTVEILKAEADAHLLYNLTGKTVKSFSLTDASVDVKLFKGIRVNGENISYQNGVLHIGTATIGIEGANPLGAAVSGTAQDIRISKEGVEWTELMVNVAKALEFGQFAFTPPQGIIRKEADSYVVIMEGAEGELNVADWLTANGSASLKWGPKNNGGLPEITAASLSVDGKSRSFPGDFLPMWPLNFGFEASIMAGPVPLTGGVSAGVDGGTSFKVSGNLNYKDGQFTFGGSVTMDPRVELELRVYAGAGIPLLVYIGGYLSGKAIATADAEVGLKGAATKASGYALDQLKAYYQIDADFLAKVSAGVDVRALYFFRKDLFEIEIKSWQLGHATLAGERSLLSPTKMQPLSASGLLDSSNRKLPSPDVKFYTRSYGKAIRTLYEALEAEGLASGKPGIIGQVEQEGKTEKTPLEVGKEQVKDIAYRAVASSFDKREIDRMRSRLTEYENQFQKIGEDFTAWLSQQQQKMDESPETGGSRSWHGHLQNKPHYQKKIEAGKKKHERVTAEKQQRIEMLRSKLDAFQAQTAMTTSIYAQLDELLNPDNDLTVTQIQAQVEAYMRHIRILKGQIVPPLPDVTTEPPIDYDQSDAE